MLLFENLASRSSSKDHWSQINYQNEVSKC